MSTEAHFINEKNLSNLQIGGQFCIDNNNSSIDENNYSTDSSNCSESGRKPSYVGLSCTVSGYSNFTRYQSPSRKTSPSAIPVSSPPQVLDCNDYERSMRQPVERNGAPVRGQLDYDYVDNATTRNFFPSTQTRKVVTSDSGETTVETVTRFYGHRNGREESPSSDSSSVGSMGSGNGNLVQKQIERLYGGGVQAVRVTSPEPRSPESEIETSDSKESGGFFAKRFGLVPLKDYSSKQRDMSSSDQEDNSFDSKTSKVPAVFRLLRPEFREQLKLNSCQVRIPLDQSTAPPKKERIIPIQRENGEKKSQVETTNETTTSPKNERVIPIVIEKKTDHSENHSPLRATVTTRTPRSPIKPALPAKPLSPSRHITPLVTSTPVKAEKSLDATLEKSLQEDLNPPVPQTPNIPDQQTISLSENEAEISRSITPLEPQAQIDATHENITSQELPEDAKDHSLDEGLADPFDPERFMRSSTSPPCGLRERSLLCPILEEDTESTASGCSVGVTRALGSKEPTPLEADPQQDVVLVDEFVILTKKEEEHDGHYFIKLLENEIFKFEEQICDFEEDLANEGTVIPDDVRDSILAAIGKAKLLISQKFVQFRGLCDKNISQNPEEDLFVPTSEDLAGFWDMVSIQVEHINTLFAELIDLRKNKWIPKPVEKPILNSQSKPRTRKVTPAAKKTPSASNAKKSELAKARDEARKKMLEAKKKAMRQMQEQKQDEVEIFIPG